MTSNVYRATLAACEYIARRNWLLLPDGEFDKGGCWRPAAGEIRECCAAVRRPSREKKFSLLVHCRSRVHVARLYDVNLDSMNKRIRELTGEAGE